MVLNNKNKIGSGIIVEGSGTNFWVDFHKISKDVFVQYPCRNEPEFFCKFKEFKNKIIPEFVSYPQLIKVELEFTDTFNGDANYSWVNRDTIEVLENISDSSLIKIAKKQMGIDLDIRLQLMQEILFDWISISLQQFCSLLFLKDKRNDYYSRSLWKYLLFKL